METRSFELKIKRKRNPIPLLAYYPLICTTVHTLFKEFRLFMLYCQISVSGEIYLIRFWNTQQIIITKKLAIEMRAQKKKRNHNSKKHLRWNSLQFLVINYCCNALRFRCLRESWICLWTKKRC